MLTFLHSCGNILDIIDDLIEAGLDVLQFDQQENMGLDELNRFAGRVSFWCPVDIQKIMSKPHDEIRSYCRRMVEKLGTEKGGFIAKCYGDPDGVELAPEAVDAMCDEFMKISDEMQNTNAVKKPA